MPKASSDTRSPEVKELQALRVRRRQLLDEKVREKNRLERTLPEVLHRSINDHLAWLEKELEEIETAIENHVNSVDEIRQTITLLTSIPGVGLQTAITMVTDVPELGTFNSKTLASLVGVAPFNRDSGKKAGQRRIKGGRSEVRKAL